MPLYMASAAFEKDANTPSNLPFSFIFQQEHMRTTVSKIAYKLPHSITKPEGNKDILKKQTMTPSKYQSLSLSNIIAANTPPPAGALVFATLGFVLAGFFRAEDVTQVIGFEMGGVFAVVFLLSVGLNAALPKEIRAWNISSVSNQPRLASYCN